MSIAGPSRFVISKCQKVSSDNEKSISEKSSASIFQKIVAKFRPGHHGVIRE
jgi:hypothetical protein